MKKVLINHIGFVALLIALDEFLKIFFVYIKKVSIDSCMVCERIVHFHPCYNVSGSFLSAAFGTLFSKVGFMICIILFGVSAGICYIWLYKQLNLYQKSIAALYGADFMFAGAFGRLIERCFWEYTFDYIGIRYVGICDLIDIYLFIGIISAIILSIYLDYYLKKKYNDKKSIA